MRPRPVAPPLARRAVRDANGRVVLAPLSAVGQRAVRLLDALEGLLGHGLLVLVGVQLERKLVECLLDLGGASGGRDACGAMDGWAAAWRKGARRAHTCGRVAQAIAQRRAGGRAGGAPSAS